MNALSHLLTKKHNNLGEESGMFFDAIIRGHYNFEKNDLFNGILKKATKADLLSFFEQFVQDKSKRKQFSIFIKSSPKSTSDHLECTKKVVEEVPVELPSTLKVFEFSRLTSWKACQSLLPLSEDRSLSN